jgi:hypothetical protein
MHATNRSSVLVACLFALCPAALHATTLNMSEDLMRLGIASQNLIPNQPALDARPLMQAAIAYVQSNPGITLLTLDTGNYYLLSNENGAAVLVFPNLSNLTIDLAGSTIYFVGPLLPNGIQLYYCTNVTLTNFQLDYLNPPYTHVKLVSVDATNRTLQYALLPNWPDPSTFNNLGSQFPVNYVAAFFRNGSIVPGTTRTQLQGPFSNSTLTVIDNAPWGQSATLATLQAGDTVVVTTRGSGSPLLIWESDGITLSYVSVYGSPDWAVQFFQDTDSVADHVSVVPRPGTGLIGSDADGIHFIPTGPNNHILSCTVRSTMDDALIMEDAYLGMVQSQPGASQLTVTRDEYIRFANGTVVDFNDPNTTLSQGEATIVSESPPDSSQPEFNGQVTLTLDRDLPTLTAGSIMVNGAAAQEGAGSTIEDNLVEDTYGGRGVWLSGTSGIAIQRNVIRRTSMAGVAVIQETDETGDPGDVGPPSGNLTITDNAFEGVESTAACGTGIGDCLAAVEVSTVDNQEFGFSASEGNTGINIARNYIADSGRSGIWLGETDGGDIEDNVVIRSSRWPTLGGTFGIPGPFDQEVEEDALIPVVIPYSSGIGGSGNVIDNNSTIASPVTMPASMTVPAGAGVYRFALTTAVPGFGWNAASDAWWLLAAQSGVGNATVEFTVSENASVLARTGHITIAGQALTVTQQGLTAEPLPRPGQR